MKEEVAEFRTLARENFGAELSEEEALDWATRCLHIFYMVNYGIHPLCPPQGPEPFSGRRRSVDTPGNSTSSPSNIW